MKYVWYKKYWQIGFLSRLYDLLAPEAYVDSLRLGTNHISGEATIFDAGCGSGLLIPLLRERLKSGYRYIGTDLLRSGVRSSKRKIEGCRVLVFQSDLLAGLSLRKESVDVVFAAFLTYTVSDVGKRQVLMRDLCAILKPGGKLILINLSRNYNAKNIISRSLEIVRKKMGYRHYWIKKCFVYPLTLRLGLNFVASQIDSNKWHAYTQDELCAETRAGGFEVTHVESVYADSAYLVVAEKPGKTKR